MTKRVPEKVRQGIDAARRGKYLDALATLGNFYDQPGSAEQSSDGLSWYGLSLAVINKDYRHAVEVCNVALERQPWLAIHYVNLAKIYLGSGNRKKAVEVVDRGLKVQPNDQELKSLRQQLGVRARPAVPFLDLSHPVKVTIGQVRHAAKKKSTPTKKGA